MVKASVPRSANSCETGFRRLLLNVTRSAGGTWIFLKKPAVWPKPMVAPSLLLLERGSTRSRQRP